MFRVGFYQFEPRFGQMAANLSNVQRTVADVSCDLLVLPELATTGYNFLSAGEALSLSEPIPGPTTEKLEALASRAGTWLVVGLAERAGSGADSRCYNSAVLVGPGGLAGTYRKVHLFDREKLVFTPGEDGFPVFELDLPDRPRVGIMICFDWRFPEAARSLALAGADVIAHPANLVMPHCQAAMVTRCLENRIFAVTANRTGVEERGGHRLRFTGGSQVIEPGGNRLALAGPAEERLEIVEIDIAPARAKDVTPHNDLFSDRRPDQYRY